MDHLNKQLPGLGNDSQGGKTIPAYTAISHGKNPWLNRAFLPHTAGKEVTMIAACHPGTLSGRLLYPGQRASSSSTCALHDTVVSHTKQLVKKGQSNQKPGEQHLVWLPRKRHLHVSTSFSL